MVIHASKAFAEHLKCEVSGANRRLPHHSSLDSWSIDLLRLTKVGTYALVMNDASLSTLIVPLQGVRNFEVFLPLMLARMEELFAQHGQAFDPKNQSVIILPRSNKSLIGTMNDAKSLIQRWIALDMDNPATDWDDLESRLNSMPYSRIGYKCPAEMLKTLLDGR